MEEQAKPKRSKHRNVKTRYDGILFDSKKEAARYQELKLAQYAGHIEQLELQPRLNLRVNDHYCGYYRADFKYFDLEKGDYIIEDVKGSKKTRTDVYMLKKKLVFALYHIEIQEII